MSDLNLATKAAAETQVRSINEAINDLNEWSQNHLIGRRTKVPGYPFPKRLKGRPAIIKSARFIQNDVYVLLNIPRLDGTGMLIDDRVRFYVDLGRLEEP